jgi:hypothetical protein
MRIWIAAAGIAAIGTWSAHVAAAAGAFTLVTNGDVAAERRFEAKAANAPPAAARGLGAPPQNPAAPPFIKIISPQPDNQAVASPIRIELAFQTSADAHVIPDSFKVLYGLLKIDITEKIRPYAKVTETGLVAENAAIPAGNHRLFLEISDSAGRTAVRELRFTVDR